jgi:hypothetical protein
MAQRQPTPGSDPHSGEQAKAESNTRRRRGGNVSAAGVIMTG